MNVRITGALLVVFIALLVAAVVTSKTGGTAQGTPTPNMGVFSFSPTDVQTLKVTTGGKSITVQQDSSGTWKLTDPAAQYSDSTHIAGAVATFAQMQKDAAVDQGTNSLSVFGLDKPYLTATATVKNVSAPVTLIAGNKNPGQSGYYAQVQGQTGLFVVALIDIDTLAQLVTQPPIATPTAVTTPLATPAAVGTPGATPTP